MAKAATKATTPKARARTVKQAGVADQQSASGNATAKSGTVLPNLLGQASERARDYATQGKDAATGRLDDFAGLVSGLADSLGDQLGPQTGDYARRAADTVSRFAEGLKGKDVDDLVDDTRRIIKQNPAMAIGAAAALGFVLVRLAKAGGSDEA